MWHGLGLHREEKQTISSAMSEALNPCVSVGYSPELPSLPALLDLNLISERNTNHAYPSPWSEFILCQHCGVILLYQYPFPIQNCHHLNFHVNFLMHIEQEKRAEK